MDSTSHKITCPTCSTEFEITEALSNQLTERIRREFDAKDRLRESEFLQKEATLSAHAAELKKKQEGVNEEINRRVGEECTQIRVEEETRAKEAVAVQLRDNATEIVDIRKRLKEHQDKELELRKQKRELEDAQQEFDLRLTRTLDQERTQIRDAAKKEIDEQRDLKDAEREKLIGDLKDQIENLKRKAEQGSQQLQGEVLELTLESLLRQHFPTDEIDPVAKGVQGGDVVHKVLDSMGTCCGSILWESKRTKNWSDGWLPKLRDEMRTAKAQLAILVSMELPRDVTNFRQIEGIWVTSYSCAVNLASALRIGLLELSAAKRANDGRSDKMEALYSYLSGSEFRHRVEGIVEAFATLKEDLEAEKRSTQRQWAKREKQLERAMAQTAGLHGDLNGIIGASLPQVEKLMLPSLPGPTENGSSVQSEAAESYRDAPPN